MSENQRFVHDGHERANHASEEVVRSEVQAEFAEQLERSSGFSKLRLRCVIEREIKHRLRQIAPSDALY
jgi:hypothetical protein